MKIKEPQTLDYYLKYFKLKKKDIIDANQNNILKNKSRKQYNSEPLLFKCSICKEKKEWNRFRFRKKGINDLGLICKDCYNNV